MTGSSSMNKAIRWQLASRWLEAIFNQTVTQFRPAMSVIRLLLTPVAVLAGALSVWRLAADAGWTNGFFIADGFLSHWQLWFAIAIGIQMSAWGLNRRIPALERK
jgi:hypothetical protein